MVVACSIAVSVAAVFESIYEGAVSANLTPKVAIHPTKITAVNTVAAFIANWRLSCVVFSSFNRSIYRFMLAFKDHNLSLFSVEILLLHR